MLSVADRLREEDRRAARVMAPDARVRLAHVPRGPRHRRRHHPSRHAADAVAGVTRLRLTDGAPVDVVVGRSAWQRGVLDRAQPATVDDIVLPVAQVADLVLLKLFAGGPQDLWASRSSCRGDDAGTIAADVESRLPALAAECARLWAQVCRSR